VVNVPIENEDTPAPATHLQVSRDHRDVVEEAKPHRAVALGVMPRGSQSSKAVVDRTVTNCVDQLHCGTGGEHGCFK